MRANWSAPLNYVSYKFLKTSLKFSVWLVVRWWHHGAGGGGDSGELLMSDWCAGSCGGGDSDEWMMTTVSQKTWTKRPADDSDSGPAAARPKFCFLLSHHFHDWVTGYASHSQCTCQRFNGWSVHCLQQVQLLLASTGWPVPGILLRWIELRTSRLTIQCSTTKPQR